MSPSMRPTEPIDDDSWAHPTLAARRALRHCPRRRHQSTGWLMNRALDGGDLMPQSLVITVELTTIGEPTVEPSLTPQTMCRLIAFHPKFKFSLNLPRGKERGRRLAPYFFLVVFSFCHRCMDSLVVVKCVCVCEFRVVWVLVLFFHLLNIMMRREKKRWDLVDSPGSVGHFFGLE